MGRVDDAIRRAALDGGRSVDVEPPAPELPAWNLDEASGAEGGGVPGHGSAPPVAAQDLPPVNTDALPWAIQEAASPRPGASRSRSHGLRFDAAIRDRIVTSSTASAMLVEQFRQFAAHLQHAQARQPLKSLMVTSASVGDGKTLTATNLALTLSTSYKRKVLLVDADLRRPSLHRIFDIQNLAGLNEVLKAGDDQKLPLVRITETLMLLPAGRAEADPLAGLSSERMKRIVRDAVSRYDWVIVDTPPVGVLADANVLSAMMDGVILVVRASSTPFAEVDSAVEVLGRDRILGVAFNAVDPENLQSKDHYYDRYYYGTERKDEASEP